MVGFVVEFAVVTTQPIPMGDIGQWGKVERTGSRDAGRLRDVGYEDDWKVCYLGLAKRWLVKGKWFGRTRTALCRLGQEGKEVDRAHGAAAERGARSDEEPGTVLGDCTGEAKQNSGSHLGM